MAKIVKNTTLSDIEIYGVGIVIEAEESHVVDPSNYRLWASAIIEDAAFQADIDSGDLVVNDGHEDLNIYEAKKFLAYPDEAWNVRFWTDDRRSNGFPNHLDTVQEAIEYAKSGAIDNDLDTFQYGRAGLIANTTFLYNLFQIPSDESPSCTKYDIIFRGLSFSNSNNSASFNVKVYTYPPNTNPIPANRTLIHTQAFSGYSGYSVDLNIDVDIGESLAVEVEPPQSGIKPQGINVILYSRKR